MGEAVKNEGGEEAESAAEHESVGSAEFAGKSTGEQAADGRHTHESHSIEAHNAAALVIVYDGLDDGVARCGRSEESETCYDQ